MSSFAFSADWLTLREPVDARARSSGLTQLAAGHLKDRAVVRIVDLATGTGANFRYLASRLPHPQDWFLVDRDPRLLRALRVEPQPTCAVATDCVDLSTPIGIDTALSVTPGLVTASAFLDLVSAAWLSDLARRCRDSGAAVLFALTYDGAFRCTPQEPEDETVRELFNAHQRTDKGFGAALGPAACDEAARRFGSLGYQIARDASNWVLGPGENELQRQTIEGWADAAVAMSTGSQATIEHWKARRLSHVAGGRSRLVIGHQDLLGWPPVDRLR